MGQWISQALACLSALYLDFAISSICYWLVGSGFQSGDTPFIGASSSPDFATDDTFRMVPLLSASMFCATAVTIVSGAIAWSLQLPMHTFCVCVVFASFVRFTRSLLQWALGLRFPLKRSTVWGAIDFARLRSRAPTGRATIALTACVCGLDRPRLGRVCNRPSHRGRKKTKPRF